jgi:hypothetical protein
MASMEGLKCEVGIYCQILKCLIGITAFITIRER